MRARYPNERALNEFLTYFSNETIIVRAANSIAVDLTTRHVMLFCA
nr:MAG TPA: hypothetical protein [Caudoviricetes sp.]